MLICRIAYDARGKDTERQANLAAHAAYLRSRAASCIVQSGPLFSSDGANTKIGALIVFDVQDIAQVNAFSANDPFILADVYDRVELLQWNRTIG
jgi:uncharacterized protein